MLRAINAKAALRFTSPLDEAPEDQKTVLIGRPVPAWVYVAVLEEARDSPSDLAHFLKLARYALVGFERFPDEETGKDYAVTMAPGLIGSQTVEMASDETMSLLHPLIQLQFGRFIDEANKLQWSDAKN